MTPRHRFAHRRLWLSIAIALAGIGLLGAAGFAGPGSHATLEARNGGTMHIDVWGYDPQYLDPGLIATAQVGGPAEVQILNAICARVFYVPDRPGMAGTTLEPELAASWPKLSHDGKTYTFTIRRGYRFSNGVAVTARDVQFSINRLLMLTPDYGGGSPYWFGDIKGADAVVHGRQRMASGLVVRGNRLVVHLLRRDNGALPAKLTMPNACVLPHTTPIDPSGVAVPVSAGPYKIDSRTAGREVVLVKNRYYHGRRSHYIDRFVFSTNLDRDRSLDEVDAGKADMVQVDESDAMHATEFAKKYGINRGRFRLDPDFIHFSVPLNTSRGPFKSVAVRQAANYALDRPAMIRAKGGSSFWGTPADQILTPGIPGYRPYTVYPLTHPDYKRAKAILKRAHARCGRVVLYMGVLQPVAKVLQASWRRIGCDVRFKIGPDIVARVGKPGEPYDATLAGWVPDYPDGSVMFNYELDGRKRSLIIPGMGGRYDAALFNNGRVNRLMDAASRLTAQARARAYQRLDALVTRKAPWAVWANENQLTLLSGRVRGYVFKYWQGGPDLAALWLKR